MSDRRNGTQRRPPSQPFLPSLPGNGKGQRERTARRPDPSETQRSQQLCKAEGRVLVMQLVKANPFQLSPQKKRPPPPVHVGSRALGQNCFRLRCFALAAMKAKPCLRYVFGWRIQEEHILESGMSRSNEGQFRIKSQRPGFQLFVQLESPEGRFNTQKLGKPAGMIRSASGERIYWNLPLFHWGSSGKIELAHG